MTEPLRGACAAARKRIGGPRRSPHARRSPLRLALRARLRAYLRAPHQPPRTTPQRTRLSPGVAITARTQGTPYGRSSCNTRRFGRFGRLGVPEDPPDEMPGGGRQPGQPALPPDEGSSRANSSTALAADEQHAAAQPRRSLVLANASGRADLPRPPFQLGCQTLPGAWVRRRGEA